MEKNTNNNIGVFIMKKFLYIITILIFIILILPKEENLRIRVIANGDSVYDQNIKMRVVEIVKEVISPNDTEDNIKQKLPILKNSINKYLTPKNIDFNISIKDEYFPKKSLNGKIIPEGYYKSLVIEIGKAEGKNWWTLLYPEYFNITYDEIESGEIETKFYFYEKYKEKFK